MQNRTYIEDRKFVAALIFELLLGKVKVLDILKIFPKRHNDPSLNAAFYALVHFEADEDLRKKDALYKEEQDEYLLEIAQTLQKGENLPVNIITSYQNYHTENLICQEKTNKNILDGLLKFINLS